MRSNFRSLAATLAACLALALLGGCGDKHAPVKPTVAGGAAQ